MAMEMTLTDMTPAQMLVLESFAGVTNEDELNALMRLLKKFYAQRLDNELEQLWNDGTLNQEKLDKLRSEHLRTPYRG
jgi:hypothetical protein